SCRSGDDEGEVIQRLLWRARRREGTMVARGARYSGPCRRGSCPLAAQIYWRSAHWPLAGPRTELPSPSGSEALPEQDRVPVMWLSRSCTAPVEAWICTGPVISLSV